MRATKAYLEDLRIHTYEFGLKRRGTYTRNDLMPIALELLLKHHITDADLRRGFALENLQAILTSERQQTKTHGGFFSERRTMILGDSDLCVQVNATLDICQREDAVHEANFRSQEEAFERYRGFSKQRRRLFIGSSHDTTYGQIIRKHKPGAAA